ncbi:hypothetical protein EDD90_7369 [Streptomyces sp. Ag109_O5-1]|uniref:DUF6907 domain-containing protein n=1 Tax=Streptomyces sp. Ag109_O5-1 TaxID=1938851 RepID=UPI000F4FE42B|nr:hypothetical protein [Streptomyces sp. Ag109_O5-1]RPE44139.1 hypothetical protein EDD90_7369 [Streptomyces sp. Ag109_O5-1]
MSLRDLPVFGPTEVLDDEGITPEVIVRTDVALSREQLAAALGIAFSDIAADQDPEQLTVLQTRTEIEGMLTAGGIVSIDNLLARDQDTEFTAERRAVMDALRRAVDRAYPADTSERPPVHKQDPRYREGTVTLDTVDHGEVTVDEPAWCIGHDDDTVGYLADVTHNGAPVTAPIVTGRYGPSKIMTARISHAPHAVELPEPFPLLSVELDAHGDLDPADGHNLARALRLAAVRVERLVAELEAVRRAEQ